MLFRRSRMRRSWATSLARPPSGRHELALRFAAPGPVSGEGLDQLSRHSGDVTVAAGDDAFLERSALRPAAVRSVVVGNHRDALTRRRERLAMLVSLVDE